MIRRSLEMLAVSCVGLLGVPNGTVRADQTCWDMCNGYSVCSQVCEDNLGMPNTCGGVNRCQGNCHASWTQVGDEWFDHAECYGPVGGEYNRAELWCIALHDNNGCYTDTTSCPEWRDLGDYPSLAACCAPGAPCYPG